MITKARPDTNHSAVVEHYAKLAPKYDKRWDRYTRRSLAAALELMDLQSSPRILDVACGTGRLEEMILARQPHARITGVDLSPEMIEVARRRIPEGNGVSWEVAPADRLPAEDASCDIVTCANAFHLVPDSAGSLGEFHRVLRPGGRLIIIDWCSEFPTVWLVLRCSRLFGRQYRQIDTLKGLRAKIEAAGFRVTHTEKFKATWFWGLMTVAAERWAAGDGA